MSGLKYLTVQDVHWVNLHVTGSPQDFNYADLEEVTFYQYGYGGSTDLLAQAARFVSGFLKKRPFESGNEGTAFISVLAFLRANGYEPAFESSFDWFKNLENGTYEPGEAISHHFRKMVDHHGLVEIRSAIEVALAEEAASLAQLGTTSTPT
ncbi:MAG TPA: hypothetical protein VJ835_02515 [Fimbriimonadaceae bacterium]|nr:hypothetical protein [Fimbriimonadaceae bacterium]